MRVLAVFPGSIYSGYAGYCKYVLRMFVWRVLLVYWGLCILLIIFPALAVFGPSVLLIFPLLAAIILDTIGLEYRNSLTTSSIQSIELKHRLHHV